MSKSGFIAIIGRPNAGKSTLLNSVLGSQISIVTPKAQTTRERVLGILTEENQGQMIFIDTPGIHKAKEGGLNAYMVQEAKDAIESPHVIWYLVDPASLIAGVKHELAVVDLLSESFQRNMSEAQASVFLLINKADRLGRSAKEKLAAPFEEIQNLMKERKIPIEGVLWISALEKSGVDQLLEQTWKLLPEGPFYYPDVEQISDRPTRFFVAEKIREQLFMKLGEEIPYSCAVEIEKFEEPKKADKKPMTRIEATIYVERDSQKGIVVGKGGKKIKEIGQAARQNIEAFLECPVFLGLEVKVLKDWSRDSESLKKMGYFLPNE